MSVTAVSILAVRGLGEVRPGDDLAALIAATAPLEPRDVVVVSQKVVSKAEGALAPLAAGDDVAAARRRLARALAADVVADEPHVVIVRNAFGLVCANAGIDASNAPSGTLVLLPEDPDASARTLRDRLRRHAGVDVAVVVADTFGRPWRLGQTDVAIGLAGLPAFRDERGGRDRAGNVLEVTQVALADEVAAAADLVRRKADGVPVVIVRGLDDEHDPAASARHLCRAPAEDLFGRGRGRLADLLGGPAPPALRALGEEDVERAVAAARRAAGTEVAVEVLDGSRRIRLSAAAVPGDLVALGVAAGTLVAAVIDLGGSAVAAPPQRDGGRAMVLVDLGPER